MGYYDKEEHKVLDRIMVSFLIVWLLAVLMLFVSSKTTMDKKNQSDLIPMSPEAVEITDSGNIWSRRSTT